jgi:copper chaperone CopZ
MKKIIITGMNCGHCVAKVKGLFEENKEVKKVEISLEQSSILLDSTLSDEAIVYILGEKYSVVSINSQI